MNRFNLTFKGEIYAGRDPERTKRRVGELLGINDPVQLENYFCGDTVVLRDNLDRKSAAEYYSKLKKLGVDVELVKVTATEAPTPDSKADTSASPPKAASPASPKVAAKETRPHPPERGGQRWAVSVESKGPAAKKSALATAIAADAAVMHKTLEQERKAAEKAVIREAELAAERKRKAEEAATQKTIFEEEKRKAQEEKRRKAEEAARLKAVREEEKRKAQEEKRRKAEEAARLKAIREEEKRKAQEEKRRKAEEAARLKAIREEEKRKAQEKKRRKAEEAARLKAIREEEKRKAQEKKRRKAEEAARLKAIREEEKRKAEKEAAKRKADEEAARREAELAEEKRRAAEERERKAHEEAANLRAAEEAARRQVELARKKRREAEEQERKAHEEAEKRKVAEETARHKAELAEKKRVEAERTRLEAGRAEQAAQRKGMEEAAVERAAQELTRQPSLQPVEAKVKTRLDVPRGKAIKGKKPGDAAAGRRNQSGAPNFYQLRPFRNTPAIKARSELSRAQARKGFLVAGLALACLLLLGGRYLGLPAAREVTGADAMALGPQSGLLLLAADRLLLHDRAGIGTRSITLEALGASELGSPLLFNAGGELLAAGRPDDNGAAGTDNGSRQLLRCDLQQPGCDILSSELAGATIAALVEHPLTGTLFMADPEAGQLLKVSSAGALLARVDTPLSRHPVMRLESGLLLLNSATGPAISVLRYDEDAFGQQLDEILLLPAPAIEAQQTRVWDFTRTADNWWVTLYNPDTNSAGVYRFDEQWNFIGQIEVASSTWPEQLASWGQKTLVRDPRQVALQRFNAQGDPEVPLVSDLLQELVTGHLRAARLQGLAWRSGLALLALITLAGFYRGILHRTRSLVYRPHRERGAEPVDELAGAVHWVAPVEDRASRIRRTGTVYTALALILIVVAITQEVGVVQLTALLIALGGPAIALLLFSRSPVGHIGILPGQLLLADHTGMYHLGGDARLQYRGAFLLVDDIVVFTGSRLLPAFSPAQVTQEVAPRARAGIRVDRKTVIIKLLQSRHPLARGAVAIAISLALAATLIALLH